MSTATLAINKSAAKAARLAASTIAKSSRQAKRSKLQRRELDAFEAQAREDGFLDEDGYFTQTTEEFLAETGLSIDDASALRP